MTRKKRLQQKKRLYRDTQEIARHVIHDPKRRRARFMCQVNEWARINKYKPGIVMFTLQYFYSVDKMVERVVCINFNTCKRFMETGGKEVVCDYEHE